MPNTLQVYYVAAIAARALGRTGTAPRISIWSNAFIGEQEFTVKKASAMANQTLFGKENGATLQRTTAESVPHYRFGPDALHWAR